MHEYFFLVNILPMSQNQFDNTRFLNPDGLQPKMKKKVFSTECISNGFLWGGVSSSNFKFWQVLWRRKDHQFWQHQSHGLLNYKIYTNSHLRNFCKGIRERIIITLNINTSSKLNDSFTFWDGDSSWIKGKIPEITDPS